MSSTTITEGELSELRSGNPGAAQVIPFLTKEERDWCRFKGCVGPCLWMIWKDASSLCSKELHEIFSELMTTGKCQRTINGKSIDVLKYVEKYLTKK